MLWCQKSTWWFICYKRTPECTICNKNKADSAYADWCSACYTDQLIKNTNAMKCCVCGNSIFLGRGICKQCSNESYNMCCKMKSDHGDDCDEKYMSGLKMMVKRFCHICNMVEVNMGQSFCKGCCQTWRNTMQPKNCSSCGSLGNFKLFGCNDKCHLRSIRSNNRKMARRTAHKYGRKYTGKADRYLWY